jgi:hypothetical protein
MERMAKHINNVNWNADDKGIRGIHTPAIQNVFEL